MTQSTTSPAAHNQKNNLREIKGIGDKTEQALHDIGVFRYADLIGYTPKSLARALKKAGYAISAKQIENGDWIGKAAIFANQRRSTRQPDGEQAPTAVSPTDAEWIEHATVTVTYKFIDTGQGPQWKTEIYHEQSGRNPELAGQQTTAVLRFIEEEVGVTETETAVDQAFPAPPVPADDDSDIPIPAAPITAAIDLQSTHIHYLSTQVDGKHQFTVDLAFGLQGEHQTQMMDQQARYQIELRCWEMETHKMSTAHLHGPFTLQPDEPTQTHSLPFSIPGPGHYELQARFLFADPFPLTVFQSVDTLRAVATTQPMTGGSHAR